VYPADSSGPGPRVSVVIPTYNRAHLIARAVESALRATAAGDEVIVVDDGSTDGTEGVASGYRSAIRYIRTANRGAGAARNRGIREASHPWVAFLDSDDEWTDDHLYLHRNYLRNSDALFSFSNFDAVYDIDSSRPRGSMKLVSWTKDHRTWDEILGRGRPYSSVGSLPPGRVDFSVHEGSLLAPMLKASYVPAWTALVRRDRAGESLCFPEDLATYEDYECFVRLAGAGPAAYLDCATALNHVHGGDRVSSQSQLGTLACHIRLLERTYGTDSAYLRGHAGTYQAFLGELRNARVRLLVSAGDTRTARDELRSAVRAPLLLRVLAQLPGPAARSLAAAYRMARLFGRQGAAF
jgi:GT2 family glycosyltransferase